jgi:predicted Zn-dependent peptidase
MLRAWHACELAEGRTLCVAVGDLLPEQLAEQLAAQFEAESPRAREWVIVAPWVAVESAGTTRGAVKRQTALAMLSRSHPVRGSRFTAEVWCAIASGLGGRLFSALRERRSWPIRSSPPPGSEPARGLVLYLATSPERETEAREALLGELARFTVQPPEPGSSPAPSTI